tara:strand:- start:24 stop:698 length:675 start_codon:yes stop_codon:yes gene_type:complete
MNISIYNTAKFSLITQIAILIICSYGLLIELEDKDMVLNEMLLLESIVQFIELLFYILLIYYFVSLKNVSVLRYYDWFITTPIMLFTLIAFMEYKNKEDEKKLTLMDIFNNNFYKIIVILILNALTLLFGVFGELKILSRNICFIIGSILFCYAFYLIYTEFVNDILINKYLFWFNFIIWSFYGIAYVFSYKYQNICYNILDIFSKNINGLLIFGYIMYIYYYI